MRRVAAIPTWWGSSNRWILLKQRDLTIPRLFAYWFQGIEPPEAHQPRWSILRDVILEAGPTAFCQRSDSSIDIVPVIQIYFWSIEMARARVRVTETCSPTLTFSRSTASPAFSVRSPPSGTAERYAARLEIDGFHHRAKLDLLRHGGAGRLSRSCGGHDRGRVGARLRVRHRGDGQSDGLVVGGDHRIAHLDPVKVGGLFRRHDLDLAALLALDDHGPGIRVDRNDLAVAGDLFAHHHPARGGLVHPAGRPMRSRAVAALPRARS